MAEAKGGRGFPPSWQVYTVNKWRIDVYRVGVRTADLGVWIIVFKTMRDNKHLDLFSNNIAPSLNTLKNDSTNEKFELKQYKTIQKKYLPLSVRVKICTLGYKLPLNVAISFFFFYYLLI